ncbi:MAG: M1 family metallopeptidase [Balneolales bacterium]
MFDKAIMHRQSVVLISTFVLFICSQPSKGQNQPDRWQQSIEYDMDVALDVDEHTISGTQNVVYTNNSPDTLYNVYYHLYFNAFQPNSLMDVRSRTIVDPDGRVQDRIYHLDEDEMGYQDVISLSHNDREVNYRVEQTVLVVELDEPILPQSQTEFDLEFEGQVPKQVRRSGRDNSEGIAYSMAQWYPKMAEYDYEGWHTHPYVAREFHGVFGDFDVKITLDSSYTVGGTGYLQNPDEVGHGYEEPGIEVARPDGNKLTWHFRAPNVIDFAWGADDQFTHEIYQRESGPRVHLLYVERPETQSWEYLGEYTLDAMEYLSENFGEYPYEQFSVIQGGDGGMEYPMATLITGHRSLYSLTSVTVHELAHMWYQTTLANNESLYSWMDEGFATYVSNYTMQHLFGIEGDPQRNSYLHYLSIVDAGLEEPMLRQSDHFTTNFAYSVASYSKGSMFLHQLGYVVGEEALQRSLKRYYDEWKFRHPNPTDFKRVVEKESDLVLDWYFDYALGTTRTIDYAIDDIDQGSDSLTVKLERKDEHIMPVDLEVEFENGESVMVYIPLGLMLGEKELEGPDQERISYDAWPWTHPFYEVTIPNNGQRAVRVEIDPSMRMADHNRLNNVRPFPLEDEFMQPAQPNWEHYGYSYRPALWYGENAGARIGMSSYGSYLFDNHVVEASLFLTTGSFDDYSVRNLDVDYNFRYRKKLDQFGLESYLEAGARRYYGVFEERVDFIKQLGEFGILEDTFREVRLSAFHQSKTADRFSDAMQSMWERGNVWGLGLTYTHGDPYRNGFKVNLTGASSGDYSSAARSSFEANRTYLSGDTFSSRFGLSFGLGSQSMPAQYRWAASRPTTEQLWNNETHWSTANIDSDLTQGIHLIANNGNGLLGYGLSGIGSPDELGNNFFSMTIWNTWQPFDGNSSLGLLSFELFSGLGKSWSGGFVDDFPVFDEARQNNIMASMGTGFTYDISSWGAFNRWRSQSKFLQNVEISVRMPFYLHDLQGEDDFGARFVIGISERF